MKINVNNNNGNSKATRRVVPPIPYDRPEKKNYAKGEYITLNLRTVPNHEGSAMHDLIVATHDLIVLYFSTGTQEEWLRWKRDLGRVLQGQNVTTDSGKYNMTRRLLKGDALAAFNVAATTHGNDTNENFLHCMDDMTAHIFPTRALQMQKRFMRRFLCKPAGIKTREFVVPKSLSKSIHASSGVPLSNFFTAFLYFIELFSRTPTQSFNWNEM